MGEKLKATRPWRQNITVKQAYVAQVKAIQHTELRAFERGYLTHIYVDEGRVIKKGQKMFQIMPMLLRAQYEKAKAEYDATEIEYQNTKNLYDQGVVSATELALVKARLKKAKANADLAQSHLELTTVKAPFTGVMDRFHVRLGSMVEEGALLTTLSDISKLWIYFNVTEKDYLNFMEQKKMGKLLKVKFQMANGKIFPHSGVVDTIEGEFDNETGTIPFRATFPNPDRLLRHGETGNILVEDTLVNALVIPQKATFEVLDKRYVYKVNAQGQLAATEVSISHEVPHLFVVEKGVSEKDTILIEGIGKVHDKETIQVELEPVEAVLKSFELEVH
ncbi:MAG: efflux RND transporter periplasmic adaptor subunit [Turneriella sp.]|nr:efflux RND transporter periplasmic adaptor subunit [Turneriella sp.]